MEIRLVLETQMLQPLVPTAKHPTPVKEPFESFGGTNISIQDAQSQFRGFLQNYKRKYRMIANGETPEAGEGNEKAYVLMLQQMKDLGLSNLNLDIKNLQAYPPTKKLFYQLQNYPQEIIPIMDQTIKDCMIDLMENEWGSDQEEIDEAQTIIYKVRPFNMEKTSNMRDLNPAGILYPSRHETRLIM